MNNHEQLVKDIARKFALIDTTPKMRVKIENGTASGAAKKTFRYRQVANMKKARACVEQMRGAHFAGWNDGIEYCGGRSKDGFLASQVERGYVPKEEFNEFMDPLPYD